MDVIKIYTHTPFRTHLSLAEHNQRLSAGLLRELFIKAEKDIERLNVDSPQGIEFKRPDEVLNEEKAMVFEYLDEDSKRIKSELFRLSLDEYAPLIQNSMRTAFQEASTLSGYQPQGVEMIDDSAYVLLFDDTIGQFMFGATLRLSGSPAPADLSLFLQTFTNTLARLVIAETYRSVILPTIKIINLRQARRKPLISPLYSHLGFPDIQQADQTHSVYTRFAPCGVPMWTSRTVIIEENYDWCASFAECWVVVRDQEVIDYDLLLDTSTPSDIKNVYLGWGHNLVIGAYGSPNFLYAMEAMVYAQYYYALFDVLSSNLTYSIAQSRNLKKIARTRHMRKTLDQLLMTFNIIKTEYRDLFFNLQATRSYFLGDVMKKWGADELLNNIDDKATVCASIINRSYQKSVNRSQKIAETLLLLLSGVAVLEYLKGLAEFDWVHKKGAPDPISGILDLGKYDPNLMQWIGIGILVIIIIIYLKSIQKRA